MGSTGAALQVDKTELDPKSARAVSPDASPAAGPCGFLVRRCCIWACDSFRTYLRALA